MWFIQGFLPSFNITQLCLKTIYSSERPLLGSGGALIREGTLIKKFSSIVLFREGEPIQINTVLESDSLAKV